VGPNYHIDALHLRRTFGRALWRVPEAWGENGWIMKNKEGTGQVVVAIIPWPLVADDEADWIYASISFAHRTGRSGRVRDGLTRSLHLLSIIVETPITQRHLLVHCGDVWMACQYYPTSSGCRESRAYEDHDDDDSIRTERCHPRGYLGSP
jgi:hypothetical protein